MFTTGQKRTFSHLFISSVRIGKFITFSIWLWKVFPSPLFTNEVLWLWNATNHLSLSMVDINLICDTSHMFINIILINAHILGFIRTRLRYMPPKNISKTKKDDEKVFEKSNISNYDIHGDCIFLNKPPKTPTIMIDDKTMSCHNWAWIWTVHFNSSQQKTAGCSSQTFNIWLSFSKRIY